MTLAIFATLIAAGYAPEWSALGWLFRIRQRCYCRPPQNAEAMLIAAAEVQPHAGWPTA